MNTFADAGIDIPSGATGEVYLTCPQCSADRRKKTAKCLGVNVEKGTWICNHCKWTGGLSNGRKNEPDAVYDYHDAAGKLLFQVVRFPGKQFRQRRPNGGGWNWKLGDVEHELLLCDLQDAIHAQGHPFKDSFLRVIHPEITLPDRLPGLAEGHDLITDSQRVAQGGGW